MIQEFSLTNILSIKETQTMSFEVALKDSEPSRHWVEMPDKTKILRMACVYGANASGKTNLLEAYDLFMDFILDGFTTLKPNSPIPVNPFHFDPETPHEPSSFEIKFYVDGHRYVYSISMTKNQVTNESLHWYETTQKKLIFSREANGEVKWGTSIKGGKKQIADMTKQNVALLNVGAKLDHSLLSKVYQSLDTMTSSLISPESGSLMQQVLKLISENPESKSELLKLLSNANFNNIQDILVESSDLPQDFLSIVNQESIDSLQKEGIDFKRWTAQIVHGFNGTTYTLPIGMESAGTRRFMELALPLFDSIRHGRMFLIDEIGCSLHEELLEYFIDTFLDQGHTSQLLFTTHILDLMDSELVRDDEVWFAIKDTQGSTEFNSITDYLGIRKDVSRKKLYEANRFGAKPMFKRMVFRKVD
ncbi:MAG: ATP-binding protein [Sphaerochaeta sp.]|nr:ATP-binding protein [Sphaerochaeta sp.]